MLKSILQSKKDKSLESVEKHLADGLKQLTGKMYNGAMVEFGKAMAINSDIVYPRLLEELEKAAGVGELESAIAIGMNLIKKKKGDYELINKLGNYAQKMKDFKQATALYKTALKINKNYKAAFYNLAAAEVKAEIINDDVVNALSQFKDTTDYILPGYIGGDNLIAELTEKASKTKQKAIDTKIRHLGLQRDKKVGSVEQDEVPEIDAKIEKLKKNMGKVSVDDVCQEFKKTIEQDPENEKDHLFDLGLYAVACQKSDIAEVALKGLSSKDYPTLELLLAIVQEQKGDLKSAINLLVQMLAQNEHSRYCNVNLGLMYRKAKKQFLSVKYLIKAAILLKKSEGIYSMSQLMHEADLFFGQGNLDKALEFYQIAATEKPDPEIRNRIGIIYRNQKQIDEAIITFKEVLEIDPNSETANQQLQQIHEYYLGMGEELFEEKKYKPSAEYFDKALSIMRSPDALKKAARAYRQLNDIKREKRLLEEADAILNGEKEKGQERLRKALIVKSKGLMKQKKYQKAIEVIETAFEMKVDKNVYLQLAVLYKKFKGADSLAGLEKRWSDMVIQKERQEALAKDKERANQANANDPE
ncbi:MAG: tetratricopeptide repeat protein [Proteobacteria bacterium]|nr:tetratricopeptide repeat protein [Pseudomonadota bacterium]